MQGKNPSKWTEEEILTSLNTGEGLAQLKQDKNVTKFDTRLERCPGKTEFVLPTSTGLLLADMYLRLPREVVNCQAKVRLALW